MTYTTNNNTNWTKGNIDGYDFTIKHFEDGSEYGIGEGRISKLEMRKNGIVVVNYDRGWDIEPDISVKSAYEKIIAKFN